MVECGLGAMEEALGHSHFSVYRLQAEVSRIFGENFYLKPGRSRGGSSHLYMSPEARKYKKELYEKLREQVESGAFPYGREFPQRVVYEFRITKDRDVSNMIKVTEDALSDAIGVDDSVWTEVVARKVRIAGDGPEVVIIELYCPKQAI